MCAALYYEDIDDPKAERFYMLACRFASNECGANSASLGVVLERYSNYLSQRGRDWEADRCEEQFRNILCEYASLNYSVSKAC